MSEMTAAIRDEAFTTGRDLDRRVYTDEALQGTIIRLCRRLADVADALDRVYDVAHTAWHLLDDSGEVDDNGNPFYTHPRRVGGVRMGPSPGGGPTTTTRRRR